MTSALRNRLSLNAPKKNVRKNGKNLREKNMSMRIGVERDYDGYNIKPDGGMSSEGRCISGRGTVREEEIRQEKDWGR